MTIQSLSNRRTKQRKSPSRPSKIRRTTLERSDVFCDGNRVTGGLTVYELLAVREKQRKLAARAAGHTKANGKHGSNKNRISQRLEK
jgi:hypothetical protein